MKAVVDDKIPYIREALETLFDEVAYVRGSDIRRADVASADALIVRTRTRVDAALLHDTRVRFVATATIGMDHLDTDYLDASGIRWTNCPGCNAESVAQYVLCALLALEQDRCLRLRDLSLGIVGLGHVGSAVRRALRPYVGRILVSDPPLGLHDPFYEADIITLHTPLTYDGPCPTYHLIDDALLRRVHSPILINAARGPVVHTEALLRALREGRVREAVIDTWEHEPDISPSLLRAAYLATPHIAGYSADGKANASRMVVDALCEWLQKPMPCAIVPPHVAFPASAAPLDYYDPRRDSDALKAHPERFEQLRGEYPVRRESPSKGQPPRPPRGGGHTGGY